MRRARRNGIAVPDRQPAAVPPVFACGTCQGQHDLAEDALARARARIVQLEQALWDARIPIPDAPAATRSRAA